MILDLSMNNRCHATQITKAYCDSFHDEVTRLGRTDGINSSVLVKINRKINSFFRYAEVELKNYKKLSQCDQEKLAELKEFNNKLKNKAADLFEQVFNSTGPDHRTSKKIAQAYSETFNSETYKRKELFKVKISEIFQENVISRLRDTDNFGLDCLITFYEKYICSELRNLFKNNEDLSNESRQMITKINADLLKDLQYLKFDVRKKHRAEFLKKRVKKFIGELYPLISSLKGNKCLITKVLNGVRKKLQKVTVVSKSEEECCFKSAMYKTLYGHALGNLKSGPNNNKKILFTLAFRDLNASQFAILLEEGLRKVEENRRNTLISSVANDPSVNLDISAATPSKRLCDCTRLFAEICKDIDKSAWISQKASAEIFEKMQKLEEFEIQQD